MQKPGRSPKPSSSERKLVHKIEEGDDPSSIYATTYQMRNFYKQFSDGFFSSLDVMNYIQHHKCVTLMKKGDRILDVCCGRGLLLPLIRYYARDIKEYVGVDISENNIAEQKRRSGAKLIDDMDSYYPFQIAHILCSCEDMDTHLNHGSMDVIIYTSAIEHMQRDVGFRSLENCFNLLKPSGTMVLSCPNTIEKKDPYDTQYAAHLYEWDLDELTKAVTEIGFHIKKIYGVVAKVRDFEAFMIKQPIAEQNYYTQLKEYLPSQWLMAFAPLLYPEAASEVFLLLSKSKGRRSIFSLKNKLTKSKYSEG